LLLYNLFLLIYRIGLRITALFNSKATEFLEGRKRQAHLWEEIFTNHPYRVVWFHCASLGEFEQGRPVIEAFRNAYPQHKVLLTFFSPSGYQTRKDYEYADWVLYLPLDSPWQARRLINLVRPEMVLFVKYEFWYYYLSELNRRNIPVLLFAAIFRPSHLFFKPYGGFYRQMLQFFSEIHVQDKASQELLQSINLKNVTVSGDTRIDRVAQIASTATPESITTRFACEDKVVIMGSLWPDDWAVISKDVQQLMTCCKFIIAPHEISENFLQKIEETFEQGSIVRYSTLLQVGVEGIQRVRALLIDNVGLLSRLYVYGTVAYVGGGFKDGLHNILEPAAFGVPVVFGNRKYRLFREANDLLAQGGAHTIARTGDLTAIIRKWLADANALQQASNICKTYVKRNTGATQKVLTSIQSYLVYPLQS
jgi:3-deoxy-D-manno-octulosonic-acid transferase